MSLQVLKNAKIYLAQYDVSGDFNQVSLQLDTESLDATTFGQTAKIALPGLESVRLTGKVFRQVDAAAPKIEDILKANLAVAQVPLSLSPLGGAAGDSAWCFKAGVASLSTGFVVGQFPAADLSAVMTGGALVRGLVLDTGTKVAGGTGTAYLLGAVAASQRVYAALHILALSGGTFTAKVQSDDAAGMATPTDRLTFTAATAKGSEWKDAAGAITDTYWRASWTLTGGSVTFALVAGIL
ncbi:MAG TPA: hypothetical protein PLE61_10425 [Vicinamibacterales bacterium]|nr:hypothetical protein [Vicinamibacterales bacterium]